MSNAIGRWRRVAAFLFALLAARASALGAQDAASAQALREWNQPRGDADLAAGCDVEPILRPPVEAWRIPFKELYADPVCWGGLVFVAGLQQREPMLSVYDLKTGKTAATSLKLSAAKPGWLAVWQGFVGFVQPDGVLILTLRGGQFTSARTRIALPNPGPPSVLAGQLFVADRIGNVHCLDLGQGKDVGHFEGGEAQPALVALEGERRALVATVTYGRPQHPDPGMTYVGQYIGLELCEVKGLGTSAPTFETRRTKFHASFEREVGPGQLAGSIPIPLAPEEGSKEPAWMLFSTQGLQTQGGKPMQAAFFPEKLAAFLSPPVVVDGFALGWVRGGELLQITAGQQEVGILEDGGGVDAKRRKATLTRARDVLYLENWALRLEDARVLWELPELDLARGLWPAGDGLALYVSAKNELVCLRDPEAGSASKPVAAKKAARPTLPGSGPGVVLRDGTRVAGAVVRAADGSVDVQPAQGAARHFAAGELALLESPEGVLRLGPELAVYRAAAGARSYDYRESLAPQIETYLQAGLVDEARGLVNRLKDFGATPAELAALDKRISGRVARDDRNAPRLHEGGQREEARLSERAAKGFVESAHWCREHALPLAASVLYADALRVQPGRSGVAEELLPLVPPGAPWQASADAPARWMALARALLPLEGAVVPLDDPSWKRLAGTPWGKGSIVLRSANLELVSRSLDPAVLGRVLLLGERAIEVLAHLIGEGQGQKRLEVRLHADEAGYRKELAQEGMANEWMAGHFSPLEDLSTFYVSDDLERVLVHELVHHFVELRWAGAAREPKHVRARSFEPGYWVAEGLAEFVAGQVLEMDRRGERFDDAEVVAVDAAAQIQGARLLIPLAQLLELAQQGFAELGDDEIAGIQLRHSLGSRPLSVRTIFYFESAALVFFLLNESGKRHAALLPAYLRGWYRNELRAESWKALGYESSEELAAAFVAFLEARRTR